MFACIAHEMFTRRPGTGPGTVFGVHRTLRSTVLCSAPVRKKMARTSMHTSEDSSVNCARSGTLRRALLSHLALETRPRA